MSWKQILSGGLALLATLATIFAVAYAIGKDHNEALVNFLREKNQALESSQTVLMAQVEYLKVELKSSRVTATAAATEIRGNAVSEANATGSLNVGSKPSAQPSHVTITASTERTVSVFDGQLLITVQGIRFDGDPLRHRIYATLGKPGKANKELNGVDPGYVAVYEGFEIRVIETDTFYAKFSIARLASSKT